MASNNGDSRSPAEIQQDIERTREELAETIDALADRVSPKAVVERGKERVRDKVSETASTVNDNVHALLSKINGSPPPTSRAAGQDTGSATLGYSTRLRTEVRADRVLLAVGAAVVLVVAVVVVRHRGDDTGPAHRRR